MTRTSKVTEVALLLHDQVCMGHNAPVPYCVAEGRADHARRTQRHKAREVLALQSLGEVARWVHENECSMYAQALHGGIYTKQYTDACGENGERHVEWLRDNEYVQQLWAQCEVVLCLAKAQQIAAQVAID